MADPITEALAPRLPSVAFFNDGRRVTEWQQPIVNEDGSITVPIVPTGAGRAVITHASITTADGETRVAPLAMETSMAAGSRLTLEFGPAVAGIDGPRGLDQGR